MSDSACRSNVSRISCSSAQYQSSPLFPPSPLALRVSYMCRLIPWERSEGERAAGVRRVRREKPSQDPHAVTLRSVTRQRAEASFRNPHRELVPAPLEEAPAGRGPAVHVRVRARPARLDVAKRVLEPPRLDEREVPNGGEGRAVDAGGAVHVRAFAAQEERVQDAHLRGAGAGDRGGQPRLRGKIPSACPARAWRSGFPGRGAPPRAQRGQDGGRALRDQRAARCCSCRAQARRLSGLTGGPIQQCHARRGCTHRLGELSGLVRVVEVADGAAGVHDTALDRLFPHLLRTTGGAAKAA